MSNSSAIPIDWRRGRAVEIRTVERDLADGTLAHISEGIAGATGEEFFRSLVKHLANALAVRYAFVTECADPQQTRVHALAFWDGASFVQGVEYRLRGT